MFDRVSRLRRSLAVRVAGTGSACTLVAVARNEGRYLAEWLAFHLAVGFARIIVFDHRSDDDTAQVLARAAANHRAIVSPPFPLRSDRPPQHAAALPMVRTPWVAFFDVDEFLVPWRDGSVGAFLARAPATVAAVHINWRSFGSSGRASADYGFVTDAFRRCAEPDWGYQTHYKTLARTRRIVEVDTHDVVLKAGGRAMSDLEPALIRSPGLSERAVFDGIQLNHYQCKTLDEFRARMALPRPNNPGDDPSNDRTKDIEMRFGMLDRNEVADDRASLFAAALRSYHARLTGLVLGR